MAVTRGSDITAVPESLQGKDEALCCLLIITQLSEGKAQVTETLRLVATATQRTCAQRDIFICSWSYQQLLSGRDQPAGEGRTVEPGGEPVGVHGSSELAH